MATCNAGVPVAATIQTGIVVSTPPWLFASRSNRLHYGASWCWRHDWYYSASGRNPGEIVEVARVLTSSKGRGRNSTWTLEAILRSILGFIEFAVRSNKYKRYQYPNNLNTVPFPNWIQDLSETPMPPAFPLLYYLYSRWWGPSQSHPHPRREVSLTSIQWCTNCIYVLCQFKIVLHSYGKKVLPASESSHFCKAILLNYLFQIKSEAPAKKWLADTHVLSLFYYWIRYHIINHKIYRDVHDLCSIYCL